MGGDWSELLPDLLATISRRLDLMEDFVAFRGVCKGWRVAAPKDNFIKLPAAVPLLMLAEQRDSDTDHREFYSFYKGKIWGKFLLPEAKNRKCMESRGWLITLEGDSGDMNLLHPFSRVQVPLPNLKTFPDYSWMDPMIPLSYVTRAALSASPSETSDYVLVVLDAYGDNLQFWRPGNKSWTKIEVTDNTDQPGPFSEVNFCCGKFYAINYSGRIWGWEVPSSSSPATAAYPLMSTGYGSTDNWSTVLVKGTDAYIVESKNEVLVVARIDPATCEPYASTGFRIGQLDLIKRQWKELKDLGGRSIFVGHNAAFSIDASNSFPDVIRPNCIYFTDDRTDAYYFTKQGGGSDMGIYSLEDGKVERCFAADIKSLSLTCPPLWVAPSFC